ncbi:MAG TPA: hypothetical protein VGO93_01205 [Candidatus Xenobia bacterium]
MSHPVDPSVEFLSLDGPTEDELLTGFRRLLATHRRVQVALYGKKDEPLEEDEQTMIPAMRKQDWTFLKQVATAPTMKELAAQIHVSVHTLKSRISRWHKALGVSGQHAVLQYFIERRRLVLLSARGEKLTPAQWRRLQKRGVSSSMACRYNKKGDLAHMTLKAISDTSPAVETTRRRKTVRQEYAYYDDAPVDASGP